VLAVWWSGLRASGSLDFLHASAHGLPGFLGLFQPPANLLYAHAEGLGIWLAVWVSPYFDVGSISVWVHPSRRHTKEAVRLIIQAYRLAFQQWPVLIGLTKVKPLLSVQERMGYTVVGSIPKLMGEGDTWIMALTPENFEAFAKDFEKVQ